MVEEYLLQNDQKKNNNIYYNNNYNNKCINCNTEFISSGNDGKYLHQIYNFVESKTNRRRGKFTTRLSKVVQDQLKLTMVEALDLVFQITDDGVRDFISNTDNNIGICISCLNIFRPLFQFYLQFVSASASLPDSLIRNVLQQKIGVHRNLQEYLKVDIEEKDDSTTPFIEEKDPLFEARTRFDDLEVTNNESEFILPLQINQEDKDMDYQKVEYVEEEGKVEIDIGFDDDDLIQLETGEEDESEEYYKDVKTDRWRPPRKIGQNLQQRSKITPTATRQFHHLQRPRNPNGSFKSSPQTRKTRPIPKCTSCCETFSSRSNLNRHLEVHKNGKPEWSCSICDSNFNHRSNLRSHMLRAHPTEKIPGYFANYNDFRCTSCPMKFLTERRLRLHIINKHLVCPLCNKGFDSKDEVNSHMESHGPNPTRSTHHCEFCDYKTTYSRCIRLHKSKIHGQIDESSSDLKECGTCGKKFIDNCAFRKHMAVHTDERPYTCDQCPMTFKHEANLRSHKKYVHDGVKFICEICGHASSSPANLRKHVRGVHHGICQTQKPKRPPEAKKKRYRAPVLEEGGV